MAAAAADEKRIFTRAELEHCARQAVASGVWRRHGFDLLRYARSLEPWRYGGHPVNPLLLREHGPKLAKLVSAAEQQQGTQGGDDEAKPNAAELRVAEQMRALAALPLELLRARIEETGHEAPGDPLACVMLAYSLGVSCHG